MLTINRKIFSVIVSVASLTSNSKNRENNSSTRLYTNIICAQNNELFHRLLALMHRMYAVVIANVFISCYHDCYHMCESSKKITYIFHILSHSFIIWSLIHYLDGKMLYLISTRRHIVDVDNWKFPSSLIIDYYTFKKELIRPVYITSITR